MEQWASIRAVSPLVDTEGGSGLASSITPELVNLQERVRDLKAALSKKSTSAGSNLFVAASGKRRRDQVTPKSDSDSNNSFFSQGLLFHLHESRREGRSRKPWIVVWAGAGRDLQNPGKPGGEMGVGTMGHGALPS